MSQINDCNCALGPFMIEYCPLHASNIDRTIMGHAALDSPNGYTFTPTHEPYTFPPFPFQETVHARFSFANDPSPDIYTLVPQLGYHAVHPVNDTSMPHSLPFEATSTATLPATGSSTTTPLDLYYDHVTAVNAIEPYGVPVGVMNQSTTTSSTSNPVVIAQSHWYTEYNVNRDANGLFRCPFAGCGKQNKRRDQLWEHWKGTHNNDPYRCSSCGSTWIYNGERSHSCNPEMTTCQICQKQVTRHHLTDHYKTQGCKNKRRKDGITGKVIDYGGSL